MLALCCVLWRFFAGDAFCACVDCDTAVVLCCGAGLQGAPFCLLNLTAALCYVGRRIAGGALVESITLRQRYALFCGGLQGVLWCSEVDGRPDKYVCLVAAPMTPPAPSRMCIRIPLDRREGCAGVPMLPSRFFFSCSRPRPNPACKPRFRQELRT